MDVQADSTGYVMSLDWFNRWKLYVGYDGDVSGEFPGPCNQDDIVDDEAIPIVIDQDNLHVDINLKDNLREETHFTIVNEEIWLYLWDLYGGRDIKWFGVATESGEPTIEVNYLKIYTYFFPLPKNDQHIDMMYISKYATVE